MLRKVQKCEGHWWHFMQVLESDAPLIIYADVKSPYAFVAIRPTLALEAELGLQFDWRPRAFALD